MRDTFRHELFQLREVERRNVLLVRAQLLRTSNRAGMEVHLPEVAPALLLAHPCFQSHCGASILHLKPPQDDDGWCAR